MTIKMLCLLIASVFYVVACTSNQPAINTANTNIAKPAATAQPAATVDELAAGRKIYADNCAACHKEDGTGGKIEIEGKTLSVDNLTSDKIKSFDDAKITRYIVNGVEDEGMPAFKDKLSEAEIREVVRYVRIGIQKITPQ